jgi:spermidine/putrescine-binding protein
MAAAGLLAMPHIRNARAATLELRWLGWEHYNVKAIVESFENEYKVRVSSGFFDGNSEAYNKLKAGGTNDFDLVMADGFWPRLYAKQGLAQPCDYNKIPNISGVFEDFKAPNYMLLTEEGGDRTIAAPNCWGGYVFTVNLGKVDAADANSVGLLFNEKYKGHLSTSARFEENIALAGILAAHGTGAPSVRYPAMSSPSASSRPSI